MDDERSFLEPCFFSLLHLHAGHWPMKRRRLCGLAKFGVAQPESGTGMFGKYCTLTDPKVNHRLWTSFASTMLPPDEIITDLAIFLSPATGVPGFLWNPTQPCLAKFPRRSWTWRCDVCLPLRFPWTLGTMTRIYWGVGEANNSVSFHLEIYSILWDVQGLHLLGDVGQLGQHGI